MCIVQAKQRRGFFFIPFLNMKMIILLHIDLWLLITRLDKAEILFSTQSWNKTHKEVNFETKPSGVSSATRLPCQSCTHLLLQTGRRKQIHGLYVKKSLCPKMGQEGSHNMCCTGGGSVGWSLGAAASEPDKEPGKGAGGEESPGTAGGDWWKCLLIVGSIQ